MPGMITSTYEYDKTRREVRAAHVQSVGGAEPEGQEICH